jgi:hypothetical protein
MTRARDHLVVALSATPPVGSLAADYLAQADTIPRPPPPQPVTPWTTEVADDLRLARIELSTGYATGRHVVDIAVQVSAGNVCIDCAPHPKGGAAHVERHLSLRRAGWDVVQARRSVWAGDRGELVVELLRHLGCGRPADEVPLT